jgi:hypothetical protein
VTAAASHDERLSGCGVILGGSRLSPDVGYGIGADEDAQRLGRPSARRAGGRRRRVFLSMGLLDPIGGRDGASSPAASVA